MHILDLPLEIIDNILYYSIISRNFPRALRLKLVCKLFYVAFRPALFRTKVLDGALWADLYRKWHCDGREHRSADILWHDYLVFRCHDRRDESIDCYVEIRDVADTLVQYCQTQEKDHSPGFDDILRTICWLALERGRRQRGAWSGWNGYWRPPSSPGLHLLSAATYFGYVPLVRDLLGQGYSSTSDDGLFPSAMYLAAWTGRADMLQLLQDHLPEYEDPNPSNLSVAWRSKIGPGSLLGAAVRGDMDMIRLSLYPPSRFVTPSVDGDNKEGDNTMLVLGQKPGSIKRDSKVGDYIGIAMNHTGSPEVYQYLRSFLNQADLPPETTNRSLEYRAGQGDIVMVRYLLDIGGSPSNKVAQGGTALSQAVRSCSDEVVDLLLERGADPNERGMFRYGTPLTAAAKAGNMVMLRKLLDAGAQFGLGYDRVTLWHAVKREHTAMVQLLLDRGVGSQQIRAHALRWAHDAELESMINLLKSNGVALQGKIRNSFVSPGLVLDFASQVEYRPPNASMTDLLRVLPHFPVGQYASLIPSLEKHQVTVSDLLTLEVADIGKRTQLPLLDLKRLCNAVLKALHCDLGVSGKKGDGDPQPSSQPHLQLRQSPSDLKAAWSTISTLDGTLDTALGGGIPTGYVTEITGESGAGKTQFLLSLLLAVQLPPPHGLSRPALYISTEAALSTRRLSQMLNNNLLFKTSEIRPSLDNIISTATPDLESQDHILTYQVPVEVERRNVGLIVLDSVAANYRAEFERGGSGQLSSNMGARSAELVRLGMLLRDLARKYNLAVVVANQVADRFGTVSPASVLRNASSLHNGKMATPYTSNLKVSQDSPLASRSRPPAHPLPHVEPSSSMADALPRSSMPEPAPPPSTYIPPPPPGSEDTGPPAPPALSLDHQQRWFTGWGDDPFASYALKTPSLGLVWSTQIACRIALLKRPAYGVSRYEGGEDEARGMPTLKTWRRWMKVVFAPHVAASGPGLDDAVEFEVNMGGLRALVKEGKK